MSKKKIIVGEDSLVIQNLTKKILSSQNYSIIPAKDGVKVLDLIKKEDYDLVLLDINMPKMDGMSCVQEIRKLDAPKKDIPVIAITGNAANYTEQDFNEAGFTDYMLKPLDFDTLVEKVKSKVH